MAVSAERKPLFPPKPLGSPVVLSTPTVNGSTSPSRRAGPIFPPAHTTNKTNGSLTPLKPLQNGQNSPIPPPKVHSSQNGVILKTENEPPSSKSPLPSPAARQNGFPESPKLGIKTPPPDVEILVVASKEPLLPPKSPKAPRSYNAPIPPPKSPTIPAKTPLLPGPKPEPKSESTSQIVSIPVRKKSFEEGSTNSPPKAEARNSFVRNWSRKLIRIEPTMPVNTLSVYSDSSGRLSVLEESGDSHSSFPCSISPGTMQSMELLFSFSDMDILDKLSDSWPVKCTYVVKEVIVTERAYVQSLTDVIKGYLSPMYSYILETGESSSFITTVFSNIVKIHQIHTGLLESMQSVSTRPEDFARVFTECDFLTQYTVYCTNYSKGNKRLEETLSSESDIKKFIVDCQKKLSHSLPLTSYLIKPVQRILKYPLLLDDLTKKFDCTDHPGHELLKQSLEKMSSVALRINTAFNEPVKQKADSPKVIAQRRFNQIRDLQKSRSLDHRQQTSPSHRSLSHSNSLPQRASLLFPVPAATLNSLRSIERSGSSARPTSMHASYEARDKNGSKPKVRDLKSFYERLTEDSEQEMRLEKQRTGSMKRTNSLDESFVEVTSPPVSRTTSLSNLLRIGRSSGKRKSSVEPQPKSEPRSFLKRFTRNKRSKESM